jgi:hypothetical protein
MAGKHRSSNPIFSQECSCLIGREAQHARILNFQSKSADIADVNVVTQLNWKCLGCYAENRGRRVAEVVAHGSK